MTPTELVELIALGAGGLTAFGMGIGIGIRGKKRSSEAPKEATKAAQSVEVSHAPQMPMLAQVNPGQALSDSQQFRIMGPQCPDHVAFVQDRKATHARISEMKREHNEQLATLEAKEVERDKSLHTLQVEWASFRATITTEFQGLRRELRAYFRQNDSETPIDHHR